MRSDTFQRIASWGKLLLVIAACLCIAYLIKRDPPRSNERPPEISVKTVTITIRDTLYLPAPQLADSYPLGVADITLPVWRPTFNREREESPREIDPATEVEVIDTEPPDSVTVQIPIEQRHYHGNEYDAWVSGWNPSLDSLHIYRQTQQIATTTEVTRWKTRRWVITGGLGMTLTPKGTIEPGIFLGVGYVIFAF